MALQAAWDVFLCARPSHAFLLSMYISLLSFWGKQMKDAMGGQRVRTRETAERRKRAHLRSVARLH